MNNMVAKIFKIYSKVIYSILKLLKTQNKILFMSRQSNNISLDFKYLIDEINKRDSTIKIVVCNSKLEKSLISKIKYFFHIHKQMYHLATSKVCIIDSYIPVVSNLNHKKELKVIQIWHSLTAIKKFGYQTLEMNSGRNKEEALSLNMHKNYDYIISGSEEMIKYFSLAFNYDKDVFRSYGLPRIDYLRKNKESIKKSIIDIYPKLKNGINILYAPTFRKYDVNIDELIKTFSDKKYNLIIKSHDLQNVSNNKVFTCDKFSALDLLTVADYLITDYSGISVEAASIKTKTLYYVYDYDKYTSENGLNIDLFKECKNLVYRDIKDIESIISNDKYDYKSFDNYALKYLPKCKNSTKEIVDLIFDVKE